MYIWLASTLLMAGYSKIEDNNQSIKNEATIVLDDNIEKQEVEIIINATNEEELIDLMKEDGKGYRLIYN